jgi:hypothetical protein
LLFVGVVIIGGLCVFFSNIEIVSFLVFIV